MDSISMDLHRRQDLRSLALHRAAVQVLLEHPERVQLVLDILTRWEGAADARSRPLCDQWRRIAESRAWDEALADTDQGQQLRQASPLGFVLDSAQRLAILDEWKKARRTDLSRPP
jgi:hypothetical protein